MRAAIHFFRPDPRSAKVKPPAGRFMAVNNRNIGGPRGQWKAHSAYLFTLYLTSYVADATPAVSGDTRIRHIYLVSYRYRNKSMKIFPVRGKL